MGTGSREENASKQRCVERYRSRRAAHSIAERFPGAFRIQPRRRFGRVRTLIAIAVIAPLIGCEVGMLLARPALQAPAASRGVIDRPAMSPALRGPEPLVADPAMESAAPFVLPTPNALDHDRARRCLADAIYYEAALEPLEGRRAVAQVVLNRVRDPNFPKSVCGVVYEGWKSGPACQFSFACDGSLARPPVAGLYRDALDVAEQALSGFVEPEVGLATHYHATSVDPSWRAEMVKVAQVGSQIFYRWPGAAGRAGAMTGRYAGREVVPPAAELMARAKSSPNLALAAAPGAIAEPSAGDPAFTNDGPVYLNGRRMRSRAEIAQMNRWLQEKRPLPASGAGPSS